MFYDLYGLENLDFIGSGIKKKHDDLLNKNKDIDFNIRHITKIIEDDTEKEKTFPNDTDKASTIKELSLMNEKIKDYSRKEILKDEHTRLEKKLQVCTNDGKRLKRKLRF